MTAKLESLIPDLEEIGFKIDENKFTFDRISYSTMIVNGQPFRQEHHNTLTLLYIGDGCEVDEEGNDIEGTEFCEFDILDEEGHGMMVVGISNIENLKSMIGL